MNVSIIGCGYVGLVTGVCLADVGHRVVCVDVDAKKVDTINAGSAPIHEAGLPELLKKNICRGFSATTDLPTAVRGSDVTLIAVGTPFNGTEIDLSVVKAAAAQIGAALTDKPSYHVVVVKSTVVPGTTDTVVGPVLAESSGKACGIDIGLGMNPEFLSEGEAIRDFQRPDRIVLGATDARALNIMAKLYESFDAPMIRTNCRTAEMIKYTSNALLANAISFANEIGNLCRAVGGIDALDVFRATHINQYLSVKNSDGSRAKAPLAAFYEAGCGFGGSCLPKDVAALIAHGQKLGHAMPVLRATLQTNHTQPLRLVAMLKEQIGELAGKRVAVLGLAFKPNTDDLRETPAIPIINKLLDERAMVLAYDPTAGAGARKLLANKAVCIANSMQECVASVDGVIVVTRWDEFQQLPALLSRINPSAWLIDGRRMIDKTAYPRYAGIGLSARESQ